MTPTMRATDAGTGPAPPDDPRASPWRILDRLIQELQHSGPAVQQVRGALAAVRDSLRADAAVWLPPGGHGPPVVVGDSRLPGPACRDFLTGVLAGASPVEGRILWAAPAADTPPAGPSAAALVRVGSGEAAWLGVVSLDPARRFQPADLDLLALARRLLAVEDRHSKLHAQLQHSLAALVRCLTATLDAKDAFTAGHSERVARIAKLLARHMGLPDRTVNTVFLAGLLHDIGKIGVPDRVLQKPGQLTRKEFAIIQGHTVIGDDILSGAKHLGHVRPGVRHHHERWDGTGYPDRLAGEAIPLVGRVLAVADSCDAMMSPRRYRPALAPPQIDLLFRQGAGRQWDPAIVEHFMGCRQDIYPPIYQKGIEESAYHAVGELAATVSEGSSMYFKVFVPDAEGEG
jgi:hypothetical protein